MSDGFVPVQPAEGFGLFLCLVCGAEREVRSDAPVPECGALSTDMNRFENGSWVRIETFESHGPMKRVLELDGVDANPFFGMTNNDGEQA